MWFKFFCFAFISIVVLGHIIIPLFFFPREPEELIFPQDSVPSSSNTPYIHFLKLLRGVSFWSHVFILSSIITSYFQIFIQAHLSFSRVQSEPLLRRTPVFDFSFFLHLVVDTHYYSQKNWLKVGFICSLSKGLQLLKYRYSYSQKGDRIQSSPHFLPETNWSSQRAVRTGRTQHHSDGRTQERLEYN